MGKFTSGSADSADRYSTGILSAATAGAGMYLRGKFNVSAWGTFVGTLTLERSFDGGTTYLPACFSDGTGVTFAAPASGCWSEPEPGVMYRLRCSAYTSGAANWRLSQ
jgi:hypothetical protein